MYFMTALPGPRRVSDTAVHELPHEIRSKTARLRLFYVSPVSARVSTRVYKSFEASVVPRQRRGSTHQ